MVYIKRRQNNAVRTRTKREFLVVWMNLWLNLELSNCGFSRSIETKTVRERNPWLIYLLGTRLIMDDIYIWVNGASWFDARIRIYVCICRKNYVGIRVPVIFESFAWARLHSKHTWLALFNSMNCRLREKWSTAIKIY